MILESKILEIPKYNCERHDTHSLSYHAAKPWNMLSYYVKHYIYLKYVKPGEALVGVCPGTSNKKDMASELFVIFTRKTGWVSFTEEIIHEIMDHGGMQITVHKHAGEVNLINILMTNV